MLKKAIYLGTALALFSACENITGKKGTHLTVKTSQEQELVLSELNPSGTVALDTSETANNKATFKINKDSANFYMVSVPNSRTSIPLFILPNEDVNLSIESDSASSEINYTVSGSPESKRIKEINGVVSRSENRLDSIANMMQAGGQTLDRAAFQKIYMEELDRARMELIAFIEEDPSSMANLFIWPQSLGNQQLVPANEYMNYYDTVAEAITQKYPNVKHATFFKEQLVKIKENVERSKKLEEAQKKISLGNEAPNIVLPDSTGTERQLKDLRGQVVLVDFWAAWCKPCRAENPNLVRTYNEFKDQGFTVFSVSLDGLPQQPNPKMAWLGAIQQDGLSWENHVSDLQGWNSPVVDVYGFQGIPFTVLIDEEGKILGKNLRGPALKQKLEKVFADK